MLVFGTRPEAIKLAPLLRELRRDPRFRTRVVVSAQHREMLDQVLELFEIAPDHDLDVHHRRQTLSGITTRALDGLDSILAGERPDAVVVQGDTTTTFAGALAAFYQRIPVVHLEAGLRTNDRYAPFPEEINRRMTTDLASLHLAPTPNNVRNLASENVPQSTIICTGNTVIDALQWAVERRAPYGQSALEDLDADGRRVVLVTAHRRESWGSAMCRIARAVARLAEDPRLRIVIPLHPNPIVRESFLPVVGALSNVTMVEPPPYGAFARLLARADLLLTDSGGIQEEGPSLGKPVLVLRDTTERPEAVTAGVAELVGTDEDLIFRAARLLLDDSERYSAMAQATNPYGDGQAAGRAAAAIAWHFGLGERPRDFDPGVDDTRDVVGAAQ